MFKILFVNPDQKLVQMYQGHIQNHFTVDSAHDGLSAFRKLRKNAPHLIISDYKLPLISGTTLLRFVRSSPSFVYTPFLFFSEYHDNSGALGLGANDWIEIKSCHPNLLLDKIYYHLKLNKDGLQIYRA